MSRPGATLILTRGLPASGKTTWARAWIAEDPTGRARVNRDDLRAMMQPEPPTFEYDREQVISCAQHAAVRALLKRGISVVVDDTHLRAKYARVWADIAFEQAAEFEIRDFYLSTDDCVARDAARAAAGGRLVGEQVIRDMAARFGGRRPEITRTEKQAATGLPAVARYVPDPDLPSAVIVDIDGTVAKMGDRSAYDYTKVGDDTPIEAVIEVVAAMSDAGHEIVFMSGREDSCRADTEAWLDTHVPVAYDRLVMRPTGDHRNDAIVKIEMFEEHVRPYFRIVATIDDRDRVVAAWRAHGLTCLQAAPGDF